MTVCACACKKQYENHKMRVYTQKNNFIKEKQNSNEGKLFILFYNPPTVDNYEPTYRLTRKCRLLFCFILSSDALSFSSSNNGNISHVFGTLFLCNPNTLKPALSLSNRAVNELFYGDP